VRDVLVIRPPIAGAPENGRAVGEPRAAEHAAGRLTQRGDATVRRMVPFQLHTGGLPWLASPNGSHGRWRPLVRIKSMLVADGP
jgi:hypothetical protein